MKRFEHLPLRPVGVVGITLLGLGLGGSTELWAQAVIALLAAILIMVAPPRIALEPVPALGLFLLLAIAFSAFLPADWGGVPDWRRHLENLHAPLGNLRTPQPWLTLQSCGLLVLGVVWGAYLFSQDWTPNEKSQATRLLAAGVIVLAGIAIESNLTGHRIAIWTQAQNRGWFPNRNQTADVLALMGIVTYVIAFRCIEKKKITGFPWMGGLAVLCAALVICYSRAGIVIFFIGIALWHVGGFASRRQGKSVAFGVASLLTLLSLFFLFGGPTLERFLNVPVPEHPYAEGYRTLIQEDAVKVSLHAPALGTGLANFEPVFTSMRKISADQNRTLHPESDWLWMAVEMGWIAPALMLLLLFWWLRQCLPFTPRMGESLRRAAFVAVLMFIGHDFVDVSGHRLGSALVGVLLASLAVSSARTRAARRWVAPCFRFAALILGVMGIWWLVSSFAEVGPPTTATLARLQERINTEAAAGRLASMGEAASAALEIAPLEWTYYFRRATAEAVRTGGADQAAMDFGIARFLEPNWIDLCMNEGEVWLAADEPDHCLDAWREALRRAGPKQAGLYATMLMLAQNNPSVRAGLKEIAGSDLDLVITFLNVATPEETKTAVDRLLAGDPDLSSLSFDQQKRLFLAWNTNGDPDDLARRLVEHPEWQDAGWKFLAQHYAGQQDFERAVVTALKYLPASDIRTISTDQPVAALASQFDERPHDLIAGVTLAQQQLAANQTDAALATIARLEKLSDCPRSVYYLEAQIEATQRQWDKAWAALQQFGAN